MHEAGLHIHAEHHTEPDQRRIRAHHRGQQLLRHWRQHGHDDEGDFEEIEEEGQEEDEQVDPQELAEHRTAGHREQHLLDPDAAIKTTITSLAERRKSSRLLEFTGLLSALQGHYAEAIDLFDHAEALAGTAADRVRLRLYRAEMFRRDEKPQTAADLLKNLLQDASVRSEPACAAMESLLREFGG